MEGQDLEVKVGADSQYYKDFLKIIEDKRMQLPELYSYYKKDETPIIGRVMDNYKGYGKTLILERFMGFDIERTYHERGPSLKAFRLWLRTGSVEDDFKLVIGNKSKNLFLSKESLKEKITDYYLFDVPCRSKSNKLRYKNNFADKMGRRVNRRGKLVDKYGNVLVVKNGKFIGDLKDIEWLIDIPKRWTDVPENFLKETYELIGIEARIKSNNSF